MNQNDVQNFWQHHLCGESFVGGLDSFRSDYEKFFEEYDQFRYDTEGHILKCLDNIEIVVPGYGGIKRQESLIYVRDDLLHCKTRYQNKWRPRKDIEEVLDIETMEEFTDYGWFDLWISADPHHDGRTDVSLPRVGKE